MRDGLLVTEVDLNLIQQIKDKWCMQVQAIRVTVICSVMLCVMECSNVICTVVCGGL